MNDPTPQGQGALYRVPVSIGTILPQSFSLFFRGFWTLMGISLVIYAPVLLGSLAFFFVSLPQGTETLVQYGSNLFFTPLATAALVHAVFQLSQEREPSLGKSLSVAFSRFWAVLGLSILLSLIFFVGYMACCIPGIIAQAGLFVAMPVLIVERARVSTTFDRSWNLTSDYKLTTFGTFLVLGLIAFTVLVLFGILVGIALGLGMESVEVLEEPEYGSLGMAGPQTVRATVLLVQLLVGVVWTTLLATAATIAYYQLRQLKEGMGEDEVLAVFE